MSGIYKPVVVFPFYFAGAKTARVQIEPFVCLRCYGISVKVILELTSGSGSNSYTYERSAVEDFIVQENIDDGFMSQAFIETMEAFYFCKADKEVLIPVIAMLLKQYFSDLLDAFQINLDEYIIDVQYNSESIGFNRSGTNHVSNNQTDSRSYSKQRVTEQVCCEEHDEGEVELSCREIVQGLKKKDHRRKTFL